MRRLILTAGLALALAACGGDKEPSAPAPSAPVKTETPLASQAETAATDIADASEVIAEDVAKSATDLGETVSETTDEMTDKANEQISKVVEDVKTEIDDTKADIGVAAIMAMLPAPYNEADLDRGAKVFRQCQSCHLIDNSGRHRVGPNLYGVMNQPAGQAEGFSFSKATTDSGIVWTAENIDKYLASPRTFIPGNRMSYAGLAKPEDREAVVAHLAVSGGLTPTE